VTVEKRLELTLPQENIPLPLLAQPCGLHILGIQPRLPLNGN